MEALSGKLVPLTDQVKQPKCTTTAAVLPNGVELLITPCLCVCACECVSVKKRYSNTVCARVYVCAHSEVSVFFWE